MPGPDAALGPDDVYVHVADDGGLFAVGADRRRSAWITADELRARVDLARARGGAVVVSAEQRRTNLARAIIEELALGGELVWADPLPETQREEGITSLMSASYVGALPLVEDLLARGAPVDARDERDYTALTFAAQAGHVEVVRRLLAAGADLESRDELGDTPVLMASWSGHPDVVRLLLLAGADARARRNDGLGLAELARARGHEPVLEAVADIEADWARDRQILGDVAPEHTSGEPELIVGLQGRRSVRILGSIVAGVIVAATFVTLLATHGDHGWVIGPVGLVLATSVFQVGWLEGNRNLWCDGRHLVITGWWREPAIDLDRVVAVHCGRTLKGPTLQLVQPDAGRRMGRLVRLQVPGGIGPDDLPPSVDRRRQRSFALALAPFGEPEVLALLAPLLLTEQEVVIRPDARKAFERVARGAA
jgi:hypothetical protein